MTCILKQILKGSEEYIEEKFSFEVNKSDFGVINNKSIYNSLITKEVTENVYGVYIWYNKSNDKVLYIGMSGRIKKTNNGFSNGGQDIRKRLISSRGNDISTSNFLEKQFENRKLSQLSVIIIKVKEGISPTFLESLILQNYYTTKQELPPLNKAF